MVKAKNKTKATAIPPESFLASVEPPQRREDGLILSGREGEHLITGFSPRKSALTIYVMPGYGNLSRELARLGKHKTGKSCLYINKLTDVDMDVLEEIVLSGLKHIRAKYQTWDE